MSGGPLERARPGPAGGATSSARARLPRRLVVVAALVGGLALPAAAYLPPGSAILKRAVQRRDELGLSAVEARGTVAFAGEAARQVASAAALPLSGVELTSPAVLTVKSPGRCRLELAPPGAPSASRPAVSVKSGRFLGARGLDGVPAARALIDGVCTLLGDRALGQRFARHGVALSDVALGRMGTRVAWVLGGRPLSGRPQAWIDKQSFLAIRLVAPLAGATRDVRLLDFGSSVGGDAFPKSVEAWSGGQLEARFTAEKVARNPKLPDALF